jgi:hypothetical protein
MHLTRPCASISALESELVVPTMFANRPNIFILSAERKKHILMFVSSSDAQMSDRRGPRTVTCTCESISALVSDIIDPTMFANSLLRNTNINTWDWSDTLNDSQIPDLWCRVAIPRTYLSRTAVRSEMADLAVPAISYKLIPGPFLFLAAIYEYPVALFWF